MIIDNKVVRNYTNMLKQIVQVDKNITELEVAEILKKINEKVDMHQIFYSNMMFLSVTVLLELLYMHQIIDINDFVYFKDKINLSIITKNVVLDVIEAKQNSLGADVITEYIKNRDSNPNEVYYQSYNTFESLVRRQRIIESFGDHNDKSILFLGDDELFCIYYAMHSNAKRIAVIDIDPLLLKEIEKANEKFHLNIEVYECDLLKEYPTELCNQFDVFFASGLKDLGGLLVFIYTGLLSLNDGLNSSGYFTFYEYNSLDETNTYMYDLQTRLLKEGIFLEHISVCDQGIIPKNVLDRIVSKIKQYPYFTAYPTHEKEITEYLRTENVFAADPIFPLFAVKPIKIARIRRTYVNTKISKLLNILRGFSKR